MRSEPTRGAERTDVRLTRPLSPTGSVPDKLERIHRDQIRAIEEVEREIARLQEEINRLKKGQGA